MVAQLVKNLPAVQESLVPFMGQGGHWETGLQATYKFERKIGVATIISLVAQTVNKLPAMQETLV